MRDALLRNLKPGARRIGFGAAIVLGFFVFLHLLLILSDSGQTFHFDLSSIALNTAFWGSVYLAMALGLTLTYRVERFPNFAHGEFFVLGCYGALFVQMMDVAGSASTERNGQMEYRAFIIGLLVGALLAGIMAVAANYLIFRRLRRRNASPQTMMITSLGLALFLRGLIYIRFHGVLRRFTPDQDLARDTSTVQTRTIHTQLGRGIEKLIEWEVSEFVFIRLKTILIVVTLLMILFTYLFLQRTRWGRALRAVSDNEDLAAASGIHVERMHALSFFIAGSLAGLAGALFVSVFPVTPEIGLFLLLPAFAVVVLGSVGNVEGAVIAAFIIGLGRALADPILAGLAQPLDRPQMLAYTEIVPFVFLIIVLLFYSQGIGLKLQERKLARIRRRSGEEE